MKSSVHRDRPSSGGQGGQVPADAAAQIGHDPGPGVAGGAVPGGELGGRLLEPGPGKEHLVGAAELGPGRDPQRLLSQRRGHQVRRIPAPQRLGQGERPLRAHILARQELHQLTPRR